MAIPSVTQPSAVWAAIDEYDRLGGRGFHEKYGFGPADEYFVSARGRLYDSKAILAAAQGYEDQVLGPAPNDFSGGGQVQRRLERLGFDVIVDRRSGDLLKLLPAIRVARDGGSERVYKPLLLLVALGRVASGEPRLAPFGTYEEVLEPLLERLSDGHGVAAVQNAWWRLPRDNLWEIWSDSGTVVRAAGEPAGTGPSTPAISELRSQTGGVPQRFHDALREVPALPATAAHVLVDRFFGDRTAEEKESLLSLASVSRAARPTDSDIHLVVKWAARHEPETIARHQEVIDRHGAVWWALFSQSTEQWQVAQHWLDQLRAQIAAGRETFVFISGPSYRKSRLHQVETDRDQVDPDLLPSYYEGLPGRQLLWLKISDFEPLSRDDLLRLLDPANKPGKPVALGNQTNPLMVRIRSKPRVWWVNQGSSFGRATEGGHLWAPMLDRNGRPLEHWQTMRHLRPGDVVLNYADTQIRGWSVVQSDPVEAPRPDPEADQAWNNDGVRAEVLYRGLQSPLSLSEIPNDWRVSEGGPFDKNGGIKQGYLFAISDSFAGKLKGRFPALHAALSVVDATATPPIPEATGPSWSPVALSDVVERITAAGLALTPETIRRYHLSLQTRGFVILAGVSGSGKSWLAEAYADAVEGQKLVVPVAPNWTTNEDLLGYLNPLDNQYYDTDFSLFLRAAASEWTQAAAAGRTPVPYYLVLDEMNLARVEYYFAKFLSAMERRARDEEAILELSPREQDHVVLTPNLFVTGTVNIDETTFGFADKVYDRAQLIEIPISREALSQHLTGRPYRAALLDVWDAVSPVAPFAFRVVDEIAAYVDAAANEGISWEQAVDEQLLQKVLPKIKGTDLRLRSSLARFVEISEDRFPLSHAKASALHAAFAEHGFTEFFSV